MRITVPLLKLGVAGGAVYAIASQGVFSISQKETIDTSRRILDSVPVQDSYLDKIPVGIPKNGISKNELIGYWNTGVKATIGAMASFPADSKELMSRGFSYMKDEISKQIK